MTKQEVLPLYWGGMSIKNIIKTLYESQKAFVSKDEILTKVEVKSSVERIIFEEVKKTLKAEVSP